MQRNDASVWCICREMKTLLLLSLFWALHFFSSSAWAACDRIGSDLFNYWGVCFYLYTGRWARLCVFVCVESVCLSEQSKEEREKYVWAVKTFEISTAELSTQLLNREATHRHQHNVCIEKKYFIQYLQKYGYDMYGEKESGEHGCKSYIHDTEYRKQCTHRWQIS